MTPRGETEDLGQLDRLDGVGQAELGAVGWDWTWETCRGQRRDSVTLMPIHTDCGCSECGVLDHAHQEQLRTGVTQTRP